MQKKSAINKFCMRVLFKLSKWIPDKWYISCLLYTSDAADE